MLERLTNSWNKVSLAGSPHLLYMRRRGILIILIDIVYASTRKCLCGRVGHWFIGIGEEVVHGRLRQRSGTMLDGDEEDNNVETGVFSGS